MVQNVHGRILLFQKIGFRIARRGGGVKRGELRTVTRVESGVIGAFKPEDSPFPAYELRVRRVETRSSEHSKKLHSPLS
jgi:hypothetical protein